MARMQGRSGIGRGNFRSSDVQARRGKNARVRDQLKSDTDETVGTKPAAQQDQFGSRHNQDKVKRDQRRTEKPRGKQDVAFRESAQELPPKRGEKNREPGRRQEHSGRPRERRS